MMKQEEIKRLVAKSENAAVEFEPDDSELGEKTQEVGEKTAEVGEKAAKLKEKRQELKEKTPELKEKTALSEGDAARNEGVNANFEVLMGAYRNDFRDNARRVLSAIVDNPEIDTARLSQALGISEISVWRAIRAMKTAGILSREGGDRGGRWIVRMQQEVAKNTSEVAKKVAKNEAVGNL